MRREIKSSKGGDMGQRGCGGGEGGMIVLKKREEKQGVDFFFFNVSSTN